MELNRQHSICWRFNMCRGNSCHEILFRSSHFARFPYIRAKVDYAIFLLKWKESRKVKKLFIREFIETVSTLVFHRDMMKFD